MCYIDNLKMQNCQLIMKTREKTARALKELGFEMTESRTNFLFARHPAIPGKELNLELRERGILVRHFNQERIRDYNRISIGTPEQMETVVATMAQILKEKSN